MGERLGVLGGTFDPPHIGHAIVAQDVLERLELDRLLVVPAGRPPHREPVLPARLRHELVDELFRAAPGIEVSDLELRRPGPSYTVDTLAEVRDRWAPEVLYCVIGSDQLRTIATWHRYERLAELATVAVMTRAGEEPVPPLAPAVIPHRTVEVTRIDLSSTRIRERLRAGRSIRFLVSERIRGRVEAAWKELERSRPAPALAGERRGTKDRGASIS